MTDFRIRRFFERLIGPRALAYMLHLRPLEWPIMSAHFLLGALMAKGLHLPIPATLLGWFVFVALMNGGTMAVNSAFDQDEGDVGYLRQPPKPPRHLFAFSMVLLAASLGLGFLLPRAFAWSNAACVIMSVLYSVPPVRLKARAGWDLVINCVGFGLLTPLAGWGLTGRPVTGAFWWAGWGFALLFGSLYPMTQIYQIEEDRSRGDRTLVIHLGGTWSLLLSLLLALGAHGCFLMGLMRGGFHVLPILVSLAAWMAVILPWIARWRRMTPHQHEAGMYRGLVAWAVTDISLLILMWPRC